MTRAAAARPGWIELGSRRGQQGRHSGVVLHWVAYESILKITPWEMRRNYSAGQRCGNEDDVLGGKPTGVIRLSLGAMSTVEDITAFVRFVEEFFVDRQLPPRPASTVPSVGPSFYVERLTVFPIKSCGGWQVPSHLAWPINPEGLAWDREWCLVHRGSGAALSQKRVPRMALLRPAIDIEADVLRVRYGGQLPSSVPEEITVPLSSHSMPRQNVTSNTIKSCSVSRVCGDPISPYIYTQVHIAAFFTAALSTPCTLARFPPGPSSRHSKLRPQRSGHQSQPTTSHPSSERYVPGTFPPTPPPSPDHRPHPILLSNESPILAISRSSVNHLNRLIPHNPTAASVFRANIILAQCGPGSEVPYDEDHWTGLRLRPLQTSSTAKRDGADAGNIIDLDVLGPCRRCQMVCVNQMTAERSEEPFVTLAKTRRREGEGSKVFFGVHCALHLPVEDVGVESERRMIRVGDMVEPVRRTYDARVW